jgi:hypothetical protein
VLRLLCLRFGVADILEHLHSPRLLLGRKHAIILVHGYAHQRLELAGQFPMPLPNVRKQLAFPVENLQTVLHRIGYPDMPIPIDGDALRT